MSLSALLTAVAEFVGDVFVNQCEREAPDRVLRYFGSNGLPQDCCTEKGVLSVAWDRGFATDTFPNEARGGAPCPSRPCYMLTIRYDTCWKQPDVDADGITLEDGTWDADAAALADLADCVARALIRLGCRADPENEKAQAVLDALADSCDGIAYSSVTPSVGGGCARLTWRAWAMPKAAT